MAQIGRLWGVFGGLDDAAKARFSTQAAAFVAAGQVRSSQLTNTYLTVYVGAATGGPVPDLPTLDPVANPVRGVPLGTVYERPVIDARVAISKGASFAEALSVGLARALQTADTDTMLAARETARDSMESIPHVVGYRRVPDSQACNFCLMASTQRYHVRDLLPLHPHCRCVTIPIIGTSDPGHVLDRELVNRLKAAGLDRRDRAQVTEHPELGPVLTKAMPAAA